jgi:hypothetical protein
MEWGGEEGQIEGFLVPLNRGDCLLAALYLRFPWRHSFQLEDRAFLFWCRQVEAALHGLNRTRAWVDKLRRLAP